MKLQLSLLTMLFFAGSAAFAQDAVYLCVNTDGSKEYKNTGDTKGCKRIEMEGLTVVPAPKRSVQTAAARPASSPADFPKIDGGKQKLLDEERRQILAGEMQAEEQKLLQLMAEYNNGQPTRLANEQGNDAKYQERIASLKEDINRTEQNIEALKREISKVR